MREIMQYYHTSYSQPPPQAIFKLIPKEEQSRLPEDENTPEKRANKLWAFFDKKDNGNILSNLSLIYLRQRKKISESLFYLYPEAAPTSHSEDYILQSAVWLNTNNKSTWVHIPSYSITRIYLRISHGP